MDISKQEIYEMVSESLSWDQFEQEIQKRYKEYDTLFDTDTVALLIADELGKNTQSILSISDLHPGVEATIVGTITYMDSVKTFQRKNGSSGRYVRLGLTDETGSIVLLLWNDDTSRIESNMIQPGSSIKIINGYTKKGYQGVEIHVGKWSSIEPINAPLEKNENTTDVAKTPGVHLKGSIQEIEATRVFFKDDGGYGFVTTIVLLCNEGKKQVTFWDEQVKVLQGFKKGDQINIHHVDIRENGGAIEFHVNGKAVIKKY